MRIEVAIKIDERRRDRSERAVFAALETRPAPCAVARPPRWPLFALPLAAAIVLGFVLPREPHEPQPIAMSPSLVTTPVGGSSRFTIGDAVVDAGGDTSLAVGSTLAGTSLTLLRGSIDCEVPPRPGRPPFHVLAGEVVVEVIGTRFSVGRSGSRVRVDVTRGKVAVTVGDVRHLVVAGESWSLSGVSVAVTPPGASSPIDEPVAPPSPEPPPRRSSLPAPIAESPGLAFKTAQRLEASDPIAAARAYRTLANGTGRWAALALVSLAELHARSAPDVALRELAELERRFPAGSNAEDAAWLRIEILRTAGRTDDARRAAGTYVRAYPRGTYVRQATRMLRP